MYRDRIKGQTKVWKFGQEVEFKNYKKNIYYMYKKIWNY